MTALPDDNGLVARARAGDQEAFGELVSRHDRAMHGIARAYFASEADAEDAVHDAFVKVFQSIGQLKADSRFAGWLTRIVVNTCIDILRSRSDRVSLPAFASSVQVSPRLGQERLTPATLAKKTEEAELVKAAVGCLPEGQRVVIMLRYAQDLSYEQIAAYLDIAESTLRTRVHRAKKALKDALDKLGSTTA